VTLKAIAEAAGVILYAGELRSLLALASELDLGGAAEILRSSPLQGKVRCIVTATPADYEECARRAPWIESSFRIVHVRPLSEADTLKVLESCKAAYARFHEVSYSDEALACIAQSAERYLAGHALPGKALQLMDAAGVRVKLRQSTVPADVVEVRKRIAFIRHRMDSAIANHEFEKARFYSEEEKKQRENLRLLEDKYPAKEIGLTVVSREDVEATIARWAEYPFRP